MCSERFARLSDIQEKSQVLHYTLPLIDND